VPAALLDGGHVAEPVVERREAPIRVLLCPLYESCVTRRNARRCASPVARYGAFVVTMRWAGRVCAASRAAPGSTRTCRACLHP